LRQTVRNSDPLRTQQAITQAGGAIRLQLRVAEAASTAFDHPIFTASIARITAALAQEHSPHYLDLSPFDPAERDVLLRVVHSSGDLSLPAAIRFSPGACAQGLRALAAGAPILTDTAMATAAVAPMAGRTFGNTVRCVLEWWPERCPAGGTRAAAGMEQALQDHPGAVVLIGSAPTALELLVQQVGSGRCPPPALVIGMPVGFVGVQESKRHLAQSGLPQIRLEGSRGGAGLVAAALNALLRRGWLDQAR